MSDDIPVNEIQVRHPGEINEKAAALATDMRHHIVIDCHVIPLVFIPGVMGSRLEGNQANPGEEPDWKMVWDPDDEWFMFRNYFSANPKTRQKLLLGPKKTFNSAYLRPCAKEDDNTYPAQSMMGQNRGWQEVSKSFYGDFLTRLWKCLEFGMTPGDQREAFPRAAWVIGNDPEHRMLGTKFPVYAVGYNWMDSNDTAGARIASRIEDILAEYRACHAGIDVPGVILITHSMGGIAARAALKLHGAEANVLGVVHGAQPAFGAAATYARFRQGFEPGGGAKGAAMRRILGNTGEKVTAVLGHGPGPLELLPWPYYVTERGKREWLTLRRGERNLITPLPQDDAGEEIYAVAAEDRPWGMVRKKWLLTGKEATLEEENKVWSDFLGKIDDVKTFQNRIGLYCHPLTYALHGEVVENDGLRGWDGVCLDLDDKVAIPRTRDGERWASWCRNRTSPPISRQGGTMNQQKVYEAWIGTGASDDFADDGYHLAEAKPVFAEDFPVPPSDVGDDDFIGYQGEGLVYRLRIGEKTGSADGTVPRASGAATIKHGQPQARTALDLNKDLGLGGGANAPAFETVFAPDTEHSAFYDSPLVQDFTLCAILAIARQKVWNK